jgi:hypothetical protein
MKNEDLDREFHPAPRSTAPLERAIARQKFFRQLDGASLEELKQFAVAMAQPENDWIN